MIRSTPRLALLLALIASRSSWALQILEARDGETLLAKVSRQEITRIAVEHERIRKITGNTGEFVLDKDDESGQVFIRPSNAESTKPINLFVTAGNDTIALLLQPVDTPSETILIRPRAQITAPTAPLPAGAAHVRRLKNLLLAMATDARPDGVEISEPHEPRSLWAGTRLVLGKRWRTNDAVGERYTLSNTGTVELALDERRLFKAGVMAVSLEQTRLAPGASTRLYLIREPDAHE